MVYVLFVVLSVVVFSMATMALFVSGVQVVKRFEWNSWRGLWGWSVILGGLIIARSILFDLIQGRPLLLVGIGLAIGFIGGGILLIRFPPRWPKTTLKGLLVQLLIFACILGYLFWDWMRLNRLLVQANLPNRIHVSRSVLILLVLIAFQFIFQFLDIIYPEKGSASRKHYG